PARHRGHDRRPGRGYRRRRGACRRPAAHPGRGSGRTGGWRVPSRRRPYRGGGSGRRARGPPLPAALLAEIMTTAGLPGGVLNVVHGSLHQKALGAETRDALVTHPGVARLAFAGDAVTGQQVMLEGAAHGKIVAVELEGTAPALIFADADLDQAIDAALFGAFALGGQRRTATSAIGVERPVYDTVVSRLAERADRVRVGAPADPAAELGPLPHPGHYDKLTSCVRLGVREGARLGAGGRRPPGP